MSDEPELQQDRQSNPIHPVPVFFRRLCLRIRLGGEAAFLPFSCCARPYDTGVPLLAHNTDVLLVLYAASYETRRGSDKKSGGGGGNRTPVPKHFSEGVYMLSLSIEFRPPRLRQTGSSAGYPDLSLAPGSSGKRPRTSLLCGAGLEPRRQWPKRRRRQLSGECVMRIGTYGFAGCFTRPPDNLGMQPPRQPARSNPVRPHFRCELVAGCADMR